MPGRCGSTTGISRQEKVSRGSSSALPMATASSRPPRSTAICPTAQPAITRLPSRWRPRLVSSHLARSFARAAAVLTLVPALFSSSALPLGAQSGVETASLPRASAGPYRAASPEYGMHLFVLGDSAATQRDLDKLTALRFGWQKSMFPWRLIEPEKGNFQWNDTDQLMQASVAAGVRVIARVDSP